MSAPAPPAVISACDDLRFEAIIDDLRFEAIIDAVSLAESYARSAAEAAWRGDRLTLRTHLGQLRLSAITAFQVFNELGLPSADPDGGPA